MRIAAGLDNDPDAADTFRQNFPEAKFFESDIRQIQTSDVRRVLPRRGLTLFSGCAPCQPFSKQNRTKPTVDPRRLLLAEFQRFVIELLPDYVVVENVPGMQRVDSRARVNPFADFVGALRSAGYMVSYDLLSAIHFGVPQVRRRLVLIASRTGVPSLPLRTHHEEGKAVPTVREWIHGLPKLNAGEVDPQDPDHAAMNLSPLNLERINATPEGGGRESWPPSLILDCHRGHSGHSDVYGRLSWNRPASAMTTRCLSYSNGRYGHPDQPRAISLREAACLQTFPRSFRFRGSLLSRGRQVGNAVPPLLAQRIGEAVISSAASLRAVRS